MFFIFIGESLSSKIEKSITIKSLEAKFFLLFVSLFLSQKGINQFLNRSFFYQEGGNATLLSQTRKKNFSLNRDMSLLYNAFKLYQNKLFNSTLLYF
jgi:hypothetical protein